MASSRARASFAHCTDGKLICRTEMFKGLLSRWPASRRFAHESKPGRFFWKLLRKHRAARAQTAMQPLAKAACRKNRRSANMKISDFRKAGHTPSLIAAFLYFDVSFMAWVLLGPLLPFIAEIYRLSATHKGLLVALPVLAGSFFRPILGVLADVVGPGRAASLGPPL